MPEQAALDTAPRPALDRWGGALLALGALAYAVAVVAFVVAYGQPAGTGPGGEVTLADRATHYGSRQQVAHLLWLLETLAALVMSVAGFVLLSRDSPPGVRFPSRVAWATLGVGAFLLSTMYPLMLGGFPAAIAADDLALFGALNGIATFVFNLGSVVAFLGLAGAFASEAAPGGVVARNLAWAGAIVCALGAFVGAGMLAGVGALAAAAPVGLVGFLLSAYLGLSIWRRA
jgi:hypothetical protein